MERSLGSLSRSLLIASLAAGLAAPPAAAAPSGGQKASGFAVEVSLGTTLVTVIANNTALTGDVLQGGVFACYKLDGFTFCLNLDLQRFATTSTAPGSDVSVSQPRTLLL